MRIPVKEAANYKTFLCELSVNILLIQENNIVNKIYFSFSHLHF